MLIHLNPNKRVFPELERFEPMNIDSSALMQFKTCPRSYFFRYVLGFDQKEEPIYFAWGTAYHKYREMLEVYYKEEGKPKDAATLDSISARALVNAMMSWGKTRDPAPESNFFWLTKKRLIDACILAHSHWKAEKARGQIEVLETEQPFNVTLPNGITISGRFDQVVRWNNRIWGRDFKTTSKGSYYFKRNLWPNDQFTRYTAAQRLLTGQRVDGQLVEVLYNERPTKSADKPPRIETETVSISESYLDMWLEEQEYWDAQLKWAREKDLYPKNEKSCGFCQFHQVCQRPTEAGQLVMLKTNYRIRVWDNTKDED
jgi:CRISPR/Cas system-associated exonuclease Cas4 (RecB family)